VYYVIGGITSALPSEIEIRYNYYLKELTSGSARVIEEGSLATKE
jgi:hypothetical protein